MRYQGKLAKWNEEKGFGFIVPKGQSQPVFVHVRDFANRQRKPRVDVAITYELGSDAQGRCCAVNVRYADEKQATVELRLSVIPMALALGFFGVVAILVTLGRLPVAVAVAYLVVSLVTFIAYSLDKKAAEVGQWRTPEKRLLFWGLVGGWPGAILAQEIFRHKSSKREFQTAFWFTVIVNAAALGWLSSPYGADARSLLAAMV